MRQTTNDIIIEIDIMSVHEIPKAYEDAILKYCDKIIGLPSDNSQLNYGGIAFDCFIKLLRIEFSYGHNNYYRCIFSFNHQSSLGKEKYDFK